MRGTAIFLVAATVLCCAPLQAASPACPADLNCDGTVNAADLALLLGAWGPCPGCDADFNNDNQVNAADLALLLGSWGPCPGQVCGGIAGIPCAGTEEFCLMCDGMCQVADGLGLCVPVPQGCPEIFDPVCGCDGQTYGNRCEAVAAGVQVDHEGSCELPICGGIAGIPCEDPNTFCEFPPGTCNVADNLGVCVPIPEVCPLIFDPVCGCDGVTYNNACFAQQAQQSIDHDGPCKGAICGTILGIPCEDPDTFCQFPPGTCKVADNAGVCVPIPEVCPLIFDPVCGCDGVTYNNACFAQQAGVSIDHAGPCEQPFCGGILGLPCENPDEFCLFPPGTCGNGDIPGECTPIPEDCPAIFDPVCGCDGVTYGNACVARQAGVSVDHDGECGEEQICGGFAGIPCEDPNTFCLFPPGTCQVADNQGVCTLIPQGCGGVFDPVCGCDGVTYSNECVAHGAQQSIDHAGECR